MSNEQSNSGKESEKEIPIQIDHKPYKAPKSTMTGLELKNLAKPPVGADYDLWLEVPGGDDRKIGDGEPVDLKPGMHFYGAPRTIDPGASHAAS